MTATMSTTDLGVGPKPPRVAGRWALGAGRANLRRGPVEGAANGVGMPS
jgi:hypothetical protein